MKRLIVLLAVLAMASVSFATDIPVEKPALSLDGNTVTMKADITGTVSPQQIKIMFCTGILGSENREIQPYYDVLFSTGLNKTTIANILNDGWKLFQVIPANTKEQFIIIFQK